MKVFNHLGGLVRDIVGITDEKHDGLVKKDLRDSQEIPNHNIDKRANSPLFAEFIKNTVNNEYEYCPKRDIFWVIGVGIEGDDEEQSNWIMDIL